MQTSDGPTNPRTRRVLKNRQMNSGSFTPHAVSPMQHLQAVIVRNSKPLGFCFGEQESEPYPRTQMSDRPAHSSHTFFWKVFRIIVTQTGNLFTYNTCGRTATMTHFEALLYQCVSFFVAFYVARVDRGRNRGRGRDGCL